MVTKLVDGIDGIGAKFRVDGIDGLTYNNDASQDWFINVHNIG